MGGVPSATGDFSPGNDALAKLAAAVNRDPGSGVHPDLFAGPDWGTEGLPPPLHR